MYRVMIIDDEPTARNHICNMLKLKCPDFTVMLTAENGKEALAKLNAAELLPDLVLTDAKMPVMNGIEFVEKAKEQFPALHFMIISGYEDFEYAKGALKFGALDYILKPVSPTLLMEALEKAKVRLREALSQRRNRLIRNISEGVEPRGAEIKTCFWQQLYYAAIIRRNGLPRRFSRSMGREISSSEGEMIYLYGRDEMEFLYIVPKELVFFKGFDEMIRGIAEKEQDTAGYQTVVIKEEAFPVDEFHQQIRSLYRELDFRSSIGYSQTIILREDQELRAAVPDQSADWYDQMAILVQKRRWEGFREEFLRLMEQWENERLSQLQLEKNIRSILYLFERRRKGWENPDYMLDDAFFFAGTMEELAESLLFIFSKGMNGESAADLKLDTTEFVDQIKNHVDGHFSEQISLQSVCREFGISQTYLNKLFRKYEDKTFYNYLIEVRINRAKQMIEEDRGFYIKDIALMVGYENQFYFSRLFRTYTGMSPSEYADQVSQ